MFSALKQGDLIYVLEKEDGLKLSVGNVVSVSNPRPKYGVSNPSFNVGLNQSMVIDMEVKTPEREFKFEGISPELGVADYGNAVISDNREAMIAKVDATCQESRQVLDDVERHKKVLDSRDAIMKVLNPSYAKEAERDEAIVNLTACLDSFEKRFGNSLSNIESLLAKAEHNKRKD